MNKLDFGNNLRELRDKAKLSQEQFAARIGVSKSSISFYELHVRIPGADVLANISETFHVSADYLLGLNVTKKADLSGLDENDIELVNHLIDVLRRKNRNKK